VKTEFTEKLNFRSAAASVGHTHATRIKHVELFIHDVAVNVSWLSCQNSGSWNTRCDDESFVSHGQFVFQTRHEHLDEAVDVAVFRLSSQCDREHGQITSYLTTRQLWHCDDEQLTGAQVSRAGEAAFGDDDQTDKTV